MKFYTVAEVKDLLQVNHAKVLSWINKCEIEAINISEGQKQARYRISQEALDKFLQARTKAKQPINIRTPKIKLKRIWSQ